MDSVNFRETVSIIDNEKIKMIAKSDGVHTAFVGIADNKRINLPDYSERQNKLLIRAVNNRTRERNYFRLYVRMLENEMTEEEFDNEIDKNEDEYVVSNDIDADLEDIRAALALSKEIKDVEDVDSMADLFSFSGSSIRKSLADK